MERRRVGESRMRKILSFGPVARDEIAVVIVDAAVEREGEVRV